MSHNRESHMIKIVNRKDKSAGNSNILKSTTTATNLRIPDKIRSQQRPEGNAGLSKSLKVHQNTFTTVQQKLATKNASLRYIQLMLTLK